MLRSSEREKSYQLQVEEKSDAINFYMGIGQSRAIKN